MPCVAKHFAPSSLRHLRACRERHASREALKPLSCPRVGRGALHLQLHQILLPILKRRVLSCGPTLHGVMRLSPPPPLVRLTGQELSGRGTTLVKQPHLREKLWTGNPKRTAGGSGSNWATTARYGCTSSTWQVQPTRCQVDWCQSGEAQKRWTTTAVVGTQVPGGCVNNEDRNPTNWSSSEWRAADGEQRF